MNRTAIFDFNRFNSSALIIEKSWKMFTLFLGNSSRTLWNRKWNRATLCAQVHIFAGEIFFFYKILHSGQTECSYVDMISYSIGFIPQQLILLLLCSMVETIYFVNNFIYEWELRAKLLFICKWRANSPAAKHSSSAHPHHKHSILFVFYFDEKLLETISDCFEWCAGNSKVYIEINTVGVYWITVNTDK